LLSEAGFSFTVEVRPTEETWPSHLPVEDVAAYLAEQKARAWGEEELSSEDTVLTADTSVFLGTTILNKPADTAEAWQMLSMLSGTSHRVVTGVAMLTKQGVRSFSETTWVDFRSLADHEIESYIATGKHFDKAGAYGIQDAFGMMATQGIRGCYYNVMGLPIARLYPQLKALGY
jgi:septum formation protein